MDPQSILPPDKLAEMQETAKLIFEKTPKQIRDEFNIATGSNITQEKLARICGFSMSTVTNYELGKNKNNALLQQSYRQMRNKIYPTGILEEVPQPERIDVRKNYKMTQAKLAEILGVTEGTIRNYESGERGTQYPNENIVVAYLQMREGNYPAF